MPLFSPHGCQSSLQSYYKKRQLKSLWVDSPDLWMTSFWGSILLLQDFNVAHNYQPLPIQPYLTSPTSWLWDWVFLVIFGLPLPPAPHKKRTMPFLLCCLQCFPPPTHTECHLSFLLQIPPQEAPFPRCFRNQPFGLFFTLASFSWPSLWCHPLLNVRL